MAATTYTCPECGATLRPKEPVPAGRKIKCPKCSAVFAPTAAPAKAAKAGAAAKPTKAVAKPEKPAAPGKVKSIYADADRDDFHDTTPYTFAAEEAASTERVTFDKIKDRFKKSARGPAQALVVKPANLMLSFGVVQCLLSLLYIVIWIWPMVFRDDAPPRELMVKCFLWIGAYAASFIWGALIVHGASKMHSLESYGWAMTGTIMAIIGTAPVSGWGAYLAWKVMEEPSVSVAGGMPGVGTHLATGIWCLRQLLKPEVKAGFAEGVPDYIQELENKS
jgi:hypothetical protein